MIKEAINELVAGKTLTCDEASMVMSEIMSGEVTPAQFGAFVTALRLKGETPDEIAGLARTMQSRAMTVNAEGPLLDTCGTGGDGSATFNISTTAAFVVAGAGVKVAKHGNRAMSSRSGSADVLEALGIKIDLNAEQVNACIETTGIGFMFAQVFHPAMKLVGQMRREIGIRTIFNILGPLTNPARASSQVLGVAEPGLVNKMGAVLQQLGCRHALVVHGSDGLDELTVTGTSLICEINRNATRTYEIEPEELGLKRASMEDLKGGTPSDNAKILRDILNGKTGPKRDIVLLNAAAALLAGDRAHDLSEGLSIATESIDSGKAIETLENLVGASQKATG